MPKKEMDVLKCQDIHMEELKFDIPLEIWQTIKPEVKSYGEKCQSHMRMKGN